MPFFYQSILQRPTQIKCPVGLTERVILLGSTTTSVVTAVEYDHSEVPALIDIVCNKTQQ